MRDSDLIVRYLVQDHERHAKTAGKLFEACDRGEVVIVVLPAAWLSAGLCSSFSTNIPVEISRRRLALLSRVLVLRYRKTVL
jgi:predicted nucleic acid-binding protein